jgi:hypothetical protein
MGLVVGLLVERVQDLSCTRRRTDLSFVVLQNGKATIPRQLKVIRRIILDCGQPGRCQQDGRCGECD